MSQLPKVLNSTAVEYALHTEYQPIMEISSMNVYGYEALARFRRKDIAYCTSSVFSNQIYSEEQLLHLEIKVKLEQIKYRPLGKPLFLNIYSCYLNEETCNRFWIPFLNSQENIVVEIVESSTHCEYTDRFIQLLGENNIPCAMDDMFADNTLFSSSNFLAAPVIKLDKVVLKRVKDEPVFAEFLKGIVSFCRLSGKILVLEGIENKNDLEIAKNLGFLYVQGFLFRDYFEKKGNLRITHPSPQGSLPPLSPNP